MPVKNQTPKPKTAPPKVKLGKIDKPKLGKADLSKLVDTLNKKFGVNAVTIGPPKDENGKVKPIERLSTGSITLDIALGGGLPLGRFTEISGDLSSTKTTQSLHMVREAQEVGLVCAFLDIEGTTDDAFMRAIGVDTDALLYSNPDSTEEATQMILDMQRSGVVHLAVLDSIAAMSPNKEQETDMDETVRMGLPQQLLGEFLRKFQMNNNRLSREGDKPFTLICINQLREAIGKYGDPEYTPGGRAKGFASTIELRLRRGDWISEGTGDNKEIVGQVVKFKIGKNKTFKRMTTGEFDFYFSDNSAEVPTFFNDTTKEIIMNAVEWGVIERTGAWYICEENKYQGIAPLIEALKNDPDAIKRLKKQVLYLVTKKSD